MSKEAMPIGKTMEVRSDADLQAIQTSVAFKNISDAIEQYRRQFGVAFLALIAFSAIHVGLVVIANLYTMQTRVSNGMLTSTSDDTQPVATAALTAKYDLEYIMTNMNQLQQVNALKLIKDASFTDAEGNFRQYTVTGFSLGGWRRSELKLFTSVGHILQFVRNQGISLYAEGSSVPQTPETSSQSRKLLSNSFEAGSAAQESIRETQQREAVNRAAWRSIVTDKFNQGDMDTLAHNMSGLFDNWAATETTIKTSVGIDPLAEFKSDAAAGSAGHKAANIRNTLAAATGESNHTVANDSYYNARIDRAEVELSTSVAAQFTAFTKNGALAFASGFDSNMVNSANNGIGSAGDGEYGCTGVTASNIVAEYNTILGGEYGEVEHNCVNRRAFETLESDQNDATSDEDVQAMKRSAAKPWVVAYMFSFMLGYTERFSTYFPKAYCDDIVALSSTNTVRRLPNVIMLHGFGGSDEFLHFLAIALDRTFNYYTNDKSNHKFMASPDGAVVTAPLDGSGPHGKKTWYLNNLFMGFHMDYIAYELRQHIENNMNVLKITVEGAAIFGFSMGGFGSYNLAFTYPKIFAVALDYNGPVDGSDCFYTNSCYLYCLVASYMCEILWTSLSIGYNPYVLIRNGIDINSPDSLTPMSHGVAVDLKNRGTNMNTDSSEYYNGYTNGFLGAGDLFVNCLAAAQQGLIPSVYVPANTAISEEGCMSDINVDTFVTGSANQNSSYVAHFTLSKESEPLWSPRSSDGTHCDQAYGCVLYCLEYPDWVYDRKEQYGTWASDAWTATGASGSTSRGSIRAFTTLFWINPIYSSMSSQYFCPVMNMITEQFTPGCYENWVVSVALGQVQTTDDFGRGDSTMEQMILLSVDANDEYGVFFGANLFAKSWMAHLKAAGLTINSEYASLPKRRLLSEAATSKKDVFIYDHSGLNGHDYSQNDIKSTVAYISDYYYSRIMKRGSTWLAKHSGNYSVAESYWEKTNWGDKAEMGDWSRKLLSYYGDYDSDSNSWDDDYVYGFNIDKGPYELLGMSNCNTYPSDDRGEESQFTVGSVYAKAECRAKFALAAPSTTMSDWIGEFNNCGNNANGATYSSNATSYVEPHCTPACFSWQVRYSNIVGPLEHFAQNNGENKNAPPSEYPNGGICRLGLYASWDGHSYPTVSSDEYGSASSHHDGNGSKKFFKRFFSDEAYAQGSHANDSSAGSHADDVCLNDVFDDENFSSDWSSWSSDSSDWSSQWSSSSESSSLSSSFSGSSSVKRRSLLAACDGDADIPDNAVVMFSPSATQDQVNAEYQNVIAAGQDAVDNFLADLEASIFDAWGDMFDLTDTMTEIINCMNAAMKVIAGDISNRATLKAGGKAAIELIRDTITNMKGTSYTASDGTTIDTSTCDRVDNNTDWQAVQTAQDGRDSPTCNETTEQATLRTGLESKAEAYLLNETAMAEDAVEASNVGTAEEAKSLSKTNNLWSRRLLAVNWTSFGNSFVTPTSDGDDGSADLRDCGGDSMYEYDKATTTWTEITQSNMQSHIVGQAFDSLFDSLDSEYSNASGYNYSKDCNASTTNHLCGYNQQACLEWAASALTEMNENIATQNDTVQVSDDFKEFKQTPGTAQQARIDACKTSGGTMISVSHQDTWSHGAELACVSHDAVQVSANSMTAVEDAFDAAASEAESLFANNPMAKGDMCSSQAFYDWLRFTMMPFLEGVMDGSNKSMSSPSLSSVLSALLSANTKQNIDLTMIKVSSGNDAVNLGISGTTLDELAKNQVYALTIDPPAGMPAGCDDRNNAKWNDTNGSTGMSTCGAWMVNEGLSGLETANAKINSEVNLGTNLTTSFTNVTGGVPTGSKAKK